MTDKHMAQRLVGLVLDSRFRIDAFLGAGGMGTVYLATQLNVNRPVAIKVIPKDAVENVQQQQRFEREARIMATVTHPNIVQFYDLGRTPDGLTYIVMEYVDGESLHTMLRQGRLTVETTLDLSAQLFSALAEAHAHGIVHRDIKPDNMLVGVSANHELRLKVLDFGLAHTAEDIRLTQTGRVFGTPFYIPPEMARGEQATPRSDLYSAGVVMYEMLTGQPPFKGQSMQVMFKHVHESPPSLQSWVDDGLLPPALVDLIDELLAKKEADRPASAAHVLERIESMRGRMTMPTMPVKRPRPGGLSALSTWEMPSFDTEQAATADHSDVKGAWAAFKSVAESAPEPDPILDPNVDASYELEGGFGETDMALRLAPAKPVDAADESVEIKVPDGADLIPTDMLKAVARAPAEITVSTEPVAPEKPTPLLSAHNQGTAHTAQVHQEGPPRRLKRSVPWIIWAVLIATVIAVGAAVYSNFAERDTRTPEEREADWARQKREAEERFAAQRETERQNTQPGSPEKGSQGPKPKVRKAKTRHNNEVIELFENQADMKPPTKIEIERRK